MQSNGTMDNFNKNDQKLEFMNGLRMGVLQRDGWCPSAVVNTQPCKSDNVKTFKAKLDPTVV